MLSDACSIAPGLFLVSMATMRKAAGVCAFLVVNGKRSGLSSSADADHFTNNSTFIEIFSLSLLHLLMVTAMLYSC